MQKEPERLSLFADPTEVEFAMSEGSVKVMTDPFRPDFGKKPFRQPRGAGHRDDRRPRGLQRNLATELGFFNKAAARNRLGRDLRTIGSWTSGDG